MRRTLLTTALLFTLTLLPLLPAAALENEQAPPLQISQDFVDHLDQQEFDQAWEMAAPLFQALNNRLEWQSKQLVIRQAYGPSIERHLRRTSYRSNFTKSPDGEYVMVQFTSRFSNRKECVETVVLVKQQPDLWLVREYVIQ